jgi:hypothetical protein
LVAVGAVPLFVTPQSKYKVSVLYNGLSSLHPELQEGLFTIILSPEHPGGGDGVKLGFCWALTIEQKQVRIIGMRANTKMFFILFPWVFISPSFASFFAFHVRSN